MFGWFFLILSKILVGSWKGRMTSRCSGFALGPPPMVRDEARWARRMVGLRVSIAEIGNERTRIFVDFCTALDSKRWMETMRESK